MNPSYRRILTSGFGGTLLVLSGWYLYAHVQWAQVEHSLRLIDVTWFLLGAGSSVVAYFMLRTARWLVLVRAVQAKATFADLYPIVAVSIGFSLLTPGQLGEALKVELLRRRGLVERVPGLGSFVIERALDAITVAALAALALVGSERIGGDNAPLLRWAALTLLAAGVLLLIGLRFVRPQGSIGNLLCNLNATSVANTQRAIVTVLTVLAWLVIALGWQASLYSIGVHLSLRDALWLMCMVTVAQAASFVPSGLGIAEVLIMETLQGLGYDQQAAIASATVLRLYGLLTILVGAIHIPLLWIDVAPRVQANDLPAR